MRPAFRRLKLHLGALIRGFLRTRRRFRLYNLVMGSLMAASGLLLLADLLPT